MADYDPPTHAEMTAAIAAGAGGGVNILTYTLTSDVDASPIPDARVWVTSDAGSKTTIASGRTNASGQVTFYLDPGAVYI